MSLLRTLQLTLLALVLVWPLRLWVGEPIFIASPSMEPTLMTGAHLFTDKLTLHFRDPKRGEIIVFRSPIEEGFDSVKRIIAVPGDTVEMKAKQVWVNGEELDEPYVQHTRAREKLKGDTMAAVEVPPDSYFVLGDNRDVSNDSSAWTDRATGRRLLFIRRADIAGKIRGIY